MASNIPEGMGRKRILAGIEDLDLDSILQSYDLSRVTRQVICYEN